MLYICIANEESRHFVVKADSEQEALQWFIDEFFSEENREDADARVIALDDPPPGCYVELDLTPRW